MRIGKSIIINGDDFGMNERCSRAIARALSSGMITDTTAVANGGFFEKAAALAFEQGFVDRIGIHFNLTEGTPLTTAIQRVPDFVSGGQFNKRYMLRPRPLSEAEEDAVYAELSTQTARLRSAGITVTHADSHHYIHNIPYLAPVIARVCGDNRITKIRLQRDLGGASGFEANNRYWRERGFITTDHFGRMSDIADSPVPENTEIMTHPDYDRNGVLIDRRGAENGFPIGEPLRDLREENGVVLRSYRDL